jgi:hypothetical protein
MSAEPLPLDLALLVRTLNAVAGVAGGIATPAGAHVLSSALGTPAAEEHLMRLAANISGIAWASASALDLALVMDGLKPPVRLAAAPVVPALEAPADPQLALWQRLRTGR